MKDALVEIFERDINKLTVEINKYRDESLLWAIAPGISNSAGNLTLHLVGNLNHFIGAVLGKSGYIRERDKEFSLKDVPLVVLTEMIEKMKLTVVNTLSAMTEEDMELDFPEVKHDKTPQTGFMLLHLLAHLNYHLGQVNYHRRLLEK